MDSSSLQLYDTVYDVLLDETRPLTSYESFAVGAEIHVSLGLPLSAIHGAEASWSEASAFDVVDQVTMSSGPEDLDARPLSCRVPSAASVASARRAPYCVVQRRAGQSGPASFW
ncbi:hypothetical protein GPECTOR_64g86 [Gonium pectorale]|uniref:Uncharacterized protein n=1 Tax=Gonium pectorale TaxID=33097 RepID=A0A150G484_GONPE|nr:hypothetical protein GPECTOR_64g86 [Gonium pectorale]|eukprot:KXZ44667.1 hypothetical protein GPECTOR_64g86 [Gonium pectorale]